MKCKCGKDPVASILGKNFIIHRCEECLGLDDFTIEMIKNFENIKLDPAFLSRECTEVVEKFNIKID